MSTFADYSRYYAAFYQEKDYVRESAYVVSSIRSHGYSGGPILELGCGQGGHAIPMARLGLDVVGVDQSPGMIAEANRHRAGLPPEESSRLRFVVGDIRDGKVEGKFGAVVSLFHVMSYLPNNDDLLATFHNARAHLDMGGLFAFDFWYGEAVLRDPPASRSKEVLLGGTHVRRSAVPQIDRACNLVDVHYHFTVTPDDGTPSFSFDETHRLRYLFAPELEQLCRATGFELVVLSEWLAEPPVPPTSWNGYLIARATSS